MSQPNRILMILQYMWHHTDEHHTVSLAELNQHLASYGLSADSRTLRKDIDQLIEFGVDIVADRKVQMQYHIATRHFDAPELKLLIDAVQSSRFITKKKSKALIKKLALFAGPYQNKMLKREMYVEDRAKADNEGIYITVDWLQTAIAENKQIAFRYFDYAPTKEKVYRHDGQVYNVSPFALLWNNDAYYLIGHHHVRDCIAKFRVDRIADPFILSKTAAPRPMDFRVEDYFSQEFSMLSGTECEITLLCENALMSNIIDRFGENVHTEIADAQHIKVKTNVSLSSNFYGWVFASGGKIKILSPTEAVQGFEEALRQYI